MHAEDEDENHAGLDENCDYDRLQEGIVVARLMITILNDGGYACKWDNPEPNSISKDIPEINNNLSENDHINHCYQIRSS